MAHEDEFEEIEAGEALEAGTVPGPLAEAVRRGHARAERALARHRESREALEAQESFDAAAHEQAARRLAETVEERERLPVSFDPPPPPANDLPPPPALAKRGTTRPRRPMRTARGPSARGRDRRRPGQPAPREGGGQREHDWLHQRRYDYDEIYSLS